MAQKVQVLLADDIDGSEAQATVQFGLDGVQYEIDLNAVHEKELRKDLATFVEHARKISVSGRSTGRGRRRTATANTARVREWARNEGIDIKDRGRVPADVMERYVATVGS